jgi:hypothetical protein
MFPAGQIGMNRMILSKIYIVVWAKAIVPNRSEKLLIYAIDQTELHGSNQLEHEGLGIGLNPMAAAINHSCDPNSFSFFEGSKIRVRSLRRILAGEEITTSYIDSTLHRPYRKALLRS